MRCFDIHCHLLTLSHPSFASIIQTFRSRPRELITSQLASFEYLAASMLNRGGEKLRNIISVMDNDCGDILALMEDDLAGYFIRSGEESRPDNLPSPLISDGRFDFGSFSCDTLVLTPLLIDFGSLQALPPDTWYHRVPRKPIETQILDVLYGIRQYRRERPEGKLEVYPFLGINPSRYTPESMHELLERWFGEYQRHAEVCKDRFLRAADLASEEDLVRAGLFAGIKLYPPLGVDPWPDEPAARETLEVLYSYAERLRIPITTHCDDGGFRVVPMEQALVYTDPERYRPVLERHPDLVLNFAHFGTRYLHSFRGMEQKEWRSSIIAMITEWPNIYTDISFTGSEPPLYAALNELLATLPDDDAERLASRILFGSDFPVNLLKVRSYLDYWRTFADASIDDGLKMNIVVHNPARFLWGSA